MWDWTGCLDSVGDAVSLSIFVGSIGCPFPSPVPQAFLPPKPSLPT